jgi:hypothetical protein
MHRAVDIERPAGLGDGDDRLACPVEIFRDAIFETEGYSFLKRRADFDLLAGDLDLQEAAPSLRPALMALAGWPDLY